MDILSAIKQIQSRVEHDPEIQGEDKLAVLQAIGLAGTLVIAASDIATNLGRIADVLERQENRSLGR